MRYQLIVEENTVYEIDTKCMEEMERVQMQEGTERGFRKGRFGGWREKMKTGAHGPEPESADLWGIDAWLL